MEFLKETEYMSDYEKGLIFEYNTNLKLLPNITHDINATQAVELRNRGILDELNELDAFNEEIFFEMANFLPERSGLDLAIWIDEAGKKRKNTHNIPRLKVQDPDDENNYISISISKDPKIIAGKFKKVVKLKPIFEYIKSHYDDLMKVWNNEIDAFEFINKYRIDKGGVNNA